MLKDHFPGLQSKWRRALAKPLAIGLALFLLVGTSPAQMPLNVWSSNGPTQPIWDMVVDPIKQNIVYVAAGDAGMVFKSIDRGASWHVSNLGLSDSFVTRLAIDPVNSGKVYAATTNHNGFVSNGVFKTTDGGSTWSRTNLPLENAGPLAIAASDPSIVYSATLTDRLVITTNAGESSNNLPLPDNGKILNLLAVDPLRSSVLYAAFDANPWAYFNELDVPCLFKTMDGGINWTRLSYGSTPGVITQTLTIDQNDPNKIYTTTNYGVYKSMDGGTSWTLRGKPTDKGLNSLAVDPHDPGVLYAGTFQAGVFRSTNDGATWTAFNTGLTQQVWELEIDRSGRFLYAATPNGVFSVRVKEYAAAVSVSGRVTDPEGRGLRNALISMTDSSGIRRTAITSSVGFYSFENVRAGESYIIAVPSRKFRFRPQTIQVEDNLSNVDIVAIQ